MSSSLTSVLWVAALGLASAYPATLSAQSPASGYAQQFVARCTAVLLGDGEHAQKLKQAGFQKRIKLGGQAWLFPPKKPADFCRLAFGNVFPNPTLMMNAIKSELVRQGFKDTGKVIPAEKAANPLAGTGAKTRLVFSKGTQAITLETAGNGRTTAPQIALQRLK
jgi:hypothetical protein